MGRQTPMTTLPFPSYEVRGWQQYKDDSFLGDVGRGDSDNWLPSGCHTKII